MGGPRKMDEVEWKARVWDILCTHARSDGSPPRMCLIDHDDHVHLLYKCGCANNCPQRNYRIDATVEMILDVVPQASLHIHAKETNTNPASEDQLAAIDTELYQPPTAAGCEAPECYICHEEYETRDELSTLPSCGHSFHR